MSSFSSSEKVPIILDPRRVEAARRPVSARHRKEKLFRGLCITVASMSVLLLLVFLIAIVSEGLGTLTTHFLTSPPHPDPQRAGFYPAVMGSVWLLVLAGLITLPIGVSAAIMLEEFSPRKNKLLCRIHGIIQLNITNLAGVPSVVYGIIGLTAFASMFGVFGTENKPALEIGTAYYDQFYNEGDQVLLVPIVDPQSELTEPADGMTAYTTEGKQIEVNVISYKEDWPTDPLLSARTLREGAYSGRISEKKWYYFRLPFGRGVLAGALTLMLVILPIVIIASQEALRAVPDSLREAALGMGATRWQMVQKVTLPSATPGIMTGSIIATSRAIGEAAPLLMIAGIVFITNPPRNIMDDFTAMPLQIYNWAQRPQVEFHELAASGIIVLLIVLLCFNAIAIFLRQKLQRPMQ